jgi:hypothetical protein
LVTARQITQNSIPSGLAAAMPISTPTEPASAWPDLLSEEDRRLILFLLSHGALEPALRSPCVVDVRLPEVAERTAPLVPDTISIEIDGSQLAAAHATLDRLDDEQNCILLRNVIQCLPDYRTFIGHAFDKLAIGGFLIVIVPHQFLYERKLQMPSRYERAHLRFYTPGTLLAEIEEAIDPCRYRVRLLADHDSGFDYGATLLAVPAGGHEIVLCLEKIAPPPWREEMEQDERQSASYTLSSPFLPAYRAEPEANPYQVIVPENPNIERVIVLKLDHRGDFMMATPAYRIIRQAFSRASIALVCGSWNRADAEALGLFDRVISFDFFAEDASAGPSPLSPEELHNAFANLVAGEHFDLAVDLRLYEDTRELLKRIDAPHKAGFDPYDLFPFLTIPLNLLVPTRDGRAEQGLLLCADFHTHVGVHHGFAMVFPERTEYSGQQFLVHGPYTRLKPGHYDFEILIEPLAEEFELYCDLAANAARQILAAEVIRVTRGRFPRIRLRSPEPLERFEVRLLTRAAGPLPPFRFLGVRYRHYGAFVGVHQRESMALLAHLVALRLQHPYTVVRA